MKQLIFGIFALALLAGMMIIGSDLTIMADEENDLTDPVNAQQERSEH